MAAASHADEPAAGGWPDEPDTGAPLVAEAIPVELRALDRWIVWRWGEINPATGKPRKPPFCPADLSRHASSTEPHTWSSFAEAAAVVEAGKADGVGFALAPPYVGVDLDDEFPEADHGAAMYLLDSYSERSVSGTGHHVVIKANLNGSGRHPKGIGVFQRDRFFYFSGEHVVGTPETIEERQTQLDQVLAQYLPKLESAPSAMRPAEPVDVDDQELIERATRAENGAKFSDLWAGQWQGYGYPSQSEADEALCCMLAFWTGRDASRIDRLFRSSGLWREKWDRENYQNVTIDAAIAATKDIYRPSRQTSSEPTRASESVESVTDSQGETEAAPAVEIVSLDSFLAEREELPQALVGSSTDAFLPAGGLVIVGGLGGSTKTTFTVDGVAHFASSTRWCGKAVDAPLRTLIIENEGPRAFFREKLRAKVDAWESEPFRHNVYVLRGPWGLFDFRNADHREQLRAAIDEHNIDLVVADPLTNLGMEGAGSLDDTGKFVRFLRACGLHDPEHPVAFWLLHHLNKTKHRDVLQALSGAWDNWADTIIVLKGDHEARLSVVTWGKIRYGSLPYSEQVTTFRWTDGYGYERIEKVERDIKAEVLAHLASDDRESGWVPSEIASKNKGGIGANLDSVKVALKELETAGEVVEIDPLAAGRKKNAHVYRSADSGAPSRHESAGVGSLLAPDSRAYSTPDSPVGGAGGVELAESADSDPPSRQRPL